MTFDDQRWGRPLRRAGVAALLALAGYAAGHAAGGWRTRRLMAAMTCHLSRTIDRGLPAPLPARFLAGETERLAEAVNATIALCRRLGWFASDLSHELRTPLTALRVELEEAVLHRDQSDVAKLVERTLPSIDRAEAVVASMLTLARVQPRAEGDRDRVDLGELIKTEVDTRRDAHPVTVRIEESVTVLAVREQIRQAMTNLLDNAQRHARHKVEVGVSREAGSALLTVEDDGDGVPEADRRRIFDRFTRLGDGRRWDRSGAGLGLTITRAIAEAHDGEIDVEDRPGGGARFVLRLPAVPDPAPGP
jgi:signal transduction histidine kinase